MLPGKRIDHYILIEQIGQGGQAAVWSAEDQQLKRTVAVKTINLSGDSSEMGTPEEQSKRFENEARIIADLEHPYILPIYTYGQTDGWLYIVMRYMAGGTLRKLIKSAPLDVDETVKLARPLADALDLAHTRQVVHRDIKSVNILLDAQNRPYLSDFGLSVTAGDTSTQSGSGTLAYMSPEQLRSEVSTYRSDLYSFGMLLYEMLVGETPSVNGQHWNLMQVMSATPLPTPGTLSPSVAEVLRRAMAIDPADRYGSASEMVEALALTIAPVALETLSLDDDDDDFFTLLPSNDPALLALNKANSLFDTALSEWADGAGRFRLYADDFKYIDSFYSDRDSWDLALSDSGKRLMLRAALEHGYKLDTWWHTVESTSDRRALALQTLNSELPTARLRAIEYLTVLEDSEPPAIPIRVASIIVSEIDAEVRHAGVILLEERAPKMAAGLSWRPTVYSEFIDDMLAELAAHDLDRHVAELAARVCGRLRSNQAVLKLAKLAQDGDDLALRALVYVRDETPNLPPGIANNLRARVLAGVSWLQFWSRQLAVRYVSAFIAGAVGLGGFVYWKYADIVPQIPGGTANAVGNGVAFGLAFGLLMAGALLLATEPASRLRAWTRPARIGASILLAWPFSFAVFYAYRELYYVTDPFLPADIPWFFGGARLFMTALAIASGVTRRVMVKAVVSTIGMFAVLYGIYRAYEAGLTQEFLLNPINSANSEPVSLLAVLVISVVFSFLTFLPEFIGALRHQINKNNQGYKGRLR
jgi:serine/threonine-protein kinase